MAELYRVTLTQPERQGLHPTISRGKCDARKLAHARVLPQAGGPGGGPKQTDEQAARALDTATRAVERVRRRFVTGSPESALLPKPSKRAYTRKLDGGREAKLIAVACAEPPAGKERWTLRLLAGRMVGPRLADGLSHETARRTPKETSGDRTRGRCGAPRRGGAASSCTTRRTCWRSTSAPATPGARWSSRTGRSGS